MTMTIEKFLEDFQDILQRDDPVDMNTRLRDMEEWDSLSVMACIAYLDKKFGVKTTFASYQELQAVADIVDLAGGAVA
jgi:acyl carrier protein